jgi:very-short-patch-repair endonuclease
LGDLGGESPTPIRKIMNEKTTRRIRGTTPKIEAAARQLRQQLTPAEARLWGAIRNRQLNGLRFRCQHPVGRFIVDFYCPADRLAIEIDGDIHLDRIEYDTARTDRLEDYGYRVIRFKNDEVLTNLDRVLNEIVRFASKLESS